MWCISAAIIIYRALRDIKPEMVVHETYYAYIQATAEEEVNDALTIFVKNPECIKRNNCPSTTL